MSDLVLTARIYVHNADWAWLQVYQNGRKAGTLQVEAEHAEQVLALLNGGAYQKGYRQGVSDVWARIVMPISTYACRSSIF